jgi:hypothetical protein
VSQREYTMRTAAIGPLFLPQINGSQENVDIILT